MLERVEFSTSVGLTVCDSRYFPIVVMQWYGTTDLPTMQRYADWIQRLLAWMERSDARGVLISDLRASERPSPTIRRAIGELRHSFEGAVQRLMLDDLLIIDNPAIRGIMTAIGWVKPDIRMHVVGSMEKALALARDTLSDAGIPAPQVEASAFVRTPPLRQA
ncbi:MAG: hypothetical protein HC927_07470 [Deltaproteobacteria bacterium]|nr:hypothetical protein [Deltaproteobacteria bacterium]